MTKETNKKHFWDKLLKLFPHNPASDQDTFLQIMGVLFLRQTDSNVYAKLQKKTSKQNVAVELNQKMIGLEENLKADIEVLPKNYDILSDDELKTLLDIFNHKSLAFPEDLNHAWYYLLCKYYSNNVKYKDRELVPEILSKLVQMSFFYNNGTLYFPLSDLGLLKRNLGYLEKLPYIECLEPDPFLYKLTVLSFAINKVNGKIEQRRFSDADPSKFNNRFDYAISNYLSDENWQNKTVEERNSFPFGYPEKSNSHYFLIQHIYSALNEKGKAAIFLPASINENEEQVIRRNIIKSNAVDIVISISEYYGTFSEPKTIWLLNKKKNVACLDKIFFIDIATFENDLRIIPGTFYTPVSVMQIFLLILLYRKDNTFLEFFIKHYFQILYHDLNESHFLLGGHLALIRFMIEDLVKEKGQVLSSEWKLFLENFNKGLDDATKKIRDTAFLYREWAREIILPSFNIELNEDNIDFLKKNRDIFRKEINNFFKELANIEKLFKSKYKELKKVDSQRIQSISKHLFRIKTLNYVRYLPEFACTIDVLHWFYTNKISETYMDIKGVCKVSSFAEIEQNDWSLSPNRYIQR
ncbi:MAG: N-6 DNA methylase [Calditrichae bacterium]|nr:N-6 DNA methylase [Calditrichia bacterium]